MDAFQCKPHTNHIARRLGIKTPKILLLYGTYGFIKKHILLGYMNILLLLSRYCQGYTIITNTRLYTFFRIS